MALRFIHGKPGSGKSCYCVSLLINMLGDWARYLIAKGEPYPRSLYTNIPLYVDEINRYLSNEIGREVDLSDQIIVLVEGFFQDEKGGFREWWKDFPEKSFVVIDEIQFYLPASLKRKTGGEGHSDRMMEFVSTHRHKQMDLIFMSQHIDNISVEVKRQIQTSYEVINVKDTVMGRFPFTIPMADIDVVRESWGVPMQLAHIRRDVHESKRKVKDRNKEIFLLKPALFNLYRSHTMSSEALDRPSLRLGRVGSVVWLLRKHAFRWGFWVVLIVTLIYSGYDILRQLPDILLSCAYGLVPASTQAEDKASVPAPVQPIVVDGHDHGISDKKDAVAADDQILGFVRGGVITPKGVLRKNDHIVVEGEKDFVSSVDVQKGVLYLGSGKKVQK